MNELKQSLEAMLYLFTECMSIEDFRNYNISPDNIDEGEAHARKIIAEARQTLAAHMTTIEKENSPIFGSS